MHADFRTGHTSGLVFGDFFLAAGNRAAAVGRAVFPGILRKLLLFSWVRIALVYSTGLGRNGLHSFHPYTMRHAHQAIRSP
jgi:hypothetical protein